MVSASLKSSLDGTFPNFVIWSFDVKQRREHTVCSEQPRLWGQPHLIDTYPAIHDPSEHKLILAATTPGTQTTINGPSST